MIVLPLFPPRPVWLKSFGLVVSFGMGTVIAVLSSVLLSPIWFALGVVLTLVLGSISLLKPGWVSIPYRIWNRVSYEFARFVRWWLLVVCFYVIFTVVGRSKSALWLARPKTSLWESRANHRHRANRSRPGVTTEESFKRGRFTPFLALAKQPDNWWALCLLPFLVFLSILEIEHEQRDVPSNVYTLF